MRSERPYGNARLYWHAHHSLIRLDDLVPNLRHQLKRYVRLLHGDHRAGPVRLLAGEYPANRGIRLQLIHEGYMAALMQGGQMEGAAEAFRVSSVASSRDVQMALVQSAARSTIPDPALRDLVRKEQNAESGTSGVAVVRRLH